MRFYTFISVHFKAFVKYFQTDGGGSKQFEGFLSSKGLVHRISCPYTPQQNGFVERRNRHIIETAITLLSVAGLSQEFWFHACAHAVYLINRMPCKSLYMDSPFLALYQKPPILQHLKIFGIVVFPYISHIIPINYSLDQCFVCFWDIQLDIRVLFSIIFNLRK